jgi:YbbR domain-containing protein
MSLEVPIEYQNRDPGMELVDSSLNTVEVHLSGAGALLRSITTDQVKVRIGLGKAVVGLNTFTITQDNISLPPGATLKKVEPQVVDVTLDIPIKKELPVQIDWIGKLSDQFIMESATVEPEIVTVIGGSRILEKISTIYTEKISLDNIEKTGRVSVNLALNPASLKVEEASNGKVVISFTVRERTAETE